MLWTEVALQLTVSQSVSQYVKVSSPLWDLWPDITRCCLKVAVLSLWGALSDEWCYELWVTEAYKSALSTISGIYTNKIIPQGKNNVII
jgi:hypothetical protein